MLEILLVISDIIMCILLHKVKDRYIKHRNENTFFTLVTFVKFDECNNPDNTHDVTQQHAFMMS